jgi:NADPH:quinone reductase-like Zn-dependent oxidoreductase
MDTATKEDAKMKAIVCTRYGPPEVLQLKEVEKPAPKDNEVRVKIRATTVHIGDVRIRSFDVPRAARPLARLMLGFRKPRSAILGMELAGDVEAVGADVTRFKTGDPVFAVTLWSNFGGYAEYKCLRQDGMLARKPSNLSYEQAAALSGGALTAWIVLRKARIQRGQKVLIYGASGSVGTFAVQIAKHLGAEVTGVCSTASLELVRSLGAGRVIDRTREDFVESGGTYDVILDAVDKLSPSHGKKALVKGGVYLNVAKDSGSRRDARVEDLLYIRELAEAGELEPVIDRRYTLEQIVEAHRYVEQGRKRGNVVVTVQQSGQD